MSETKTLPEEVGTPVSQASPKKERMPEQDIAKGIGIILVIALHTLTLEKSVYTLLAGFFGFLMPFFFFMAGYNHKPGRHTYKEMIRRRVKQILVPLLIYSLAITVVSGAFLMITEGYTLQMVVNDYLLTILSRPTARMIGITEAGKIHSCLMACWFVEMLFVATLIFYAVADYALAKTSRFISVFLALIAVTSVFAYFDIHLPFYFSEAPAVAAIMLAGALFGQNRLLTRHTKTNWIIINCIVAYAVFLLLAAKYRTGFLVGGSIWRTEPRVLAVLLTVLFAVVGSYAFVHFSRLFVKTGIVAKALIWCGNHSLELLFLHGIVQLFLCSILGMEPFRMSVASEINDFRTFYLFALEMVGTVGLICLIGYIKKSMPASAKR